LCHEIVSTKAGETPTRQDFLRKTFKVGMSDIHEPKRDGIKEAEIVLAFPIDESPPRPSLYLRLV
jgi:hypothetical protein